MDESKKDFIVAAARDFLSLSPKDWAPNMITANAKTRWVVMGCRTRKEAEDLVTAQAIKNKNRKHIAFFRPFLTSELRVGKLVHLVMEGQNQNGK